MAQKNTNNTYTIYDDQTIGTVNIADEVITTIVALAATEVEGVDSLGGGITHEKAARAGERALAKGVKVDMDENGVVSCRVIIIICYGYNIPDITRKVQERIKSAVETMTGLEVADVNVSVADVTVESKQ